MENTRRIVKAAGDTGRRVRPDLAGPGALFPRGTPCNDGLIPLELISSEHMEILIVFIVFGLIGLVMLSLNKLLGPRQTNPLKEQPFECGSIPLEAEVKPYRIPFGLAAFLFLLFDVEVVFFFPWALVFREMRRSAGLIMGIYVGVLLVGFIYAWRSEAFRWE